MAHLNKYAQRGVTLVEVMFAGSLLALAVISIFEGVGVCTRIAHENAQFLVADAYAHDLAWKRSQESYSALNNLVLTHNGTPIVETISSNAVPKLWLNGAPPISYTTLSWPRNAAGEEEKTGIIITVDVEWGMNDKRFRLSSASHTVQAFKSGIGLEAGQ